MFPFERGALLDKSAGFKQLPQTSQTNHKHDVNTDPQIIGKTIKNQMRYKIKSIINNVPSFQVVAPVF